MKTYDIFIFAGEQSGDLHGAELLYALKQKEPNLQIMGVGGPKMRSQGIYSIEKMESFQVMGLSDVIKALPKLVFLFKNIRNTILKNNPKAVIFIDYPDFNMRMAKSLRKNGYTGKLIHYICPSVWAWRKGRIKDLAETLDLLLTIFPFEPQYFEKTPLKVEYVGNSLVKNIKDISGQR